MTTMQKALLIYLLAVNLFGFFLCFHDKRAAKKERWRTPEKNFFLTALLGGAIGVMLGMRCFHHKTKHWYFVVGIPAIFIAELALIGFVWWKWFRL